MQTLSRLLLRTEIFVAASLVAIIFATMVAGALARTAGRPLLWADELAVHLMVCLAFIGASMGVALRNHMAIGVLPDYLSVKGKNWLALIADGLVLVFLGVMLVLCWRWFDLPGLFAAGSGKALAAQTFNFVHVDPTQTLGLRKVWFWSIVPLSTLTAMLHTLAQIGQDISALSATTAEPSA